MLLYQILAYTVHGKTKKSHAKTINLKYHLRSIMKNLSDLTDRILYLILKIISNIS